MKSSPPYRRVLVLGNALSPHVQRWSAGYLREGYEVHLISIRASQIPGVILHTAAIGPVNDPHWAWALLSYARLLLMSRRLYRDIQPTVVNAHFSLTHGTIAAVMRLRPLVITAWGRDVVGAVGVVKGWRAWLNRWVLRQADVVTVTSCFMVDPVRSLAGSKIPIVRVAFGVDTELFHPAVGEKSGRFAVGFAKHLTSKYGPDVLIEAMPFILQSVPDAHLLMAGDGILRSTLQQRVEALGMENHVTFLGKRPHGEIPELMQQLDVLVNPSVEDSETFGVTILEASASGVPVIASQIGGVSEVVVDGHTGILIPPQDPVALAQAVVSLATNPGLRSQMAKAGRQFVTAEYEWQSCIKRMTETLDDVSRQSRERTR